MPGDEYTIGQHTARIDGVERAVERIERSLTDHRDEERLTWDEFRESLKEIKKEIDNLRLWKSSVMGIAAFIATGMSIFWHAFLTKVTKP